MEERRSGGGGAKGGLTGLYGWGILREAQHEKEVIMMALSKEAFPRLRNLPPTLPLEGAIRMELQEGVPVFCSPNSVQERIEWLVH